MNELDMIEKIGYFLIAAAAIVIFVGYVVSYCENSPMLEDEEEAEDEPKGFAPNHDHIKGILAEVRSLRTPLVNYRNASAPYCEGHAEEVGK